MFIARRVEAQWNRTELTENVTSVHTAIDELSRASLNKLIAAHILWCHKRLPTCLQLFLVAGFVCADLPTLFSSSFRNPPKQTKFQGSQDQNTMLSNKNGQRLW